MSALDDYQCAEAESVWHKREYYRAARRRAQAVARMHDEGAGYRTIAAMLGMSHPRVQQLVALARVREAGQ